MDAAKVLIRHAGRSFEATPENWESVLADAIAQTATPFNSDTRIERETSTFSRQVMSDADTVDRITRIRESIGLTDDKGKELFQVGTRMADEGYAKQAHRKIEHDSRMSAQDAADQLIARIEGEQRKEVVITAREASRLLSVNGKLRIGDYALSEQALRGLLARIGSPATGYVFGMRERLRAEYAKAVEERDAALIREERGMLADVLQHELARSEMLVRFRVREALKDCFAVTSPEYGTADAPMVLPEVLSNLPSNARASFAYDPTSTRWEMRAYIFTATPTDQQAVGEPFEGYASVTGIDNATGRLVGGGGVLVIACLNATTYTFQNGTTSRVHRGRILVNLSAFAEGATAAIHTLAKAWGTAREEVITAPALTDLTVDQLLLTAGIYRHAMTARGSELVSVLPGRRETHVKALAETFQTERRNSSQLVRADFAQGWTRYLQGFEPDTRRNAEAAIGSWMVNRTPIGFAKE